MSLQFLVMTVFSALLTKDRSSLKVVSIGKRRRISSAFTSAREGSSITTTVSRSSHHQLRVLLLSFTSSLFLLLSFIGPCGSFQFFHIDTSSHKHINMSAMKSLLAFNTKMRPRGYTSPLMFKSSSLKLNHLSTMRDNSRNLHTTKMMMMTTSSFNTDRTALSQTPLGTDSASHLLHGLDVYTIYSNDGQKHPMSLYESIPIQIVKIVVTEDQSYFYMVEHGLRFLYTISWEENSTQMKIVMDIINQDH